MKELQGVELVKTSGLNFKIIPHDDVTSALRPLYIKHGIDQEVSILESRQLEGGCTELLVEVQWVNVDEPADLKRVVSIGHATSTQKDKATGLMKRDDLGVGKALSYAVKMAQLKNFALLSGDGDLEQEQAQPPKQVAVAEVERVLNRLSTAQTPEQFKVAAEEAAAIAGGVTKEQSELMSKAWSAAKERVSKPIEQQSQPLPESLGGQPDTRSTYEKVTGEVHLDPNLTAELQLHYSRVRTVGELSDIRKRAKSLMDKMSPAQKQLLKEADDKANKLLQMQQEAAR